MNNEFNTNKIIIGGSYRTILPCENIKAELLNCSSALFILHRESLRILPNLIISKLKQRLTIQLNDSLNIQSCANLRVLTGTAFYLYSLFSDGTMQGVI